MKRAPALLCAALAAAVLGATAGCNSGSGSGKRPPPPPAPQLNVARTSPLNGATAVPPDAEIEAEFSAAVDFATIDLATFAVEGSASGAMDGARARQSDRVAIFRASRPYTRGETVRVKLSNAIRAASGAALDPVEFSFTVKEPDPPPPPPPLTVAAAVPGPYENDVPADAIVEVLFSEALDANTIGPTTAYLTADGGGRLDAALALGDEGRRLTFRPAAPFAAGDLLRVHLTAAIRPASGAPFPGATYQFRAAAAAPPPRPPSGRGRGSSAPWAR